MNTITTRKSLIGASVLHGSPGYQTPEVIESITPTDSVGIYEVQFESGVFTHLSGDELYDLQDDGEVHYTDRNGGFAVITL
jgi:hypothetical protein